MSASKTAQMEAQRIGTLPVEERVAIGEAIEQLVGERRGRPGKTAVN